MEQPIHRVVLAITGASGIPLGVRLLQRLAQMPQVELGCVFSSGAARVWQHECAEKMADLAALAAHAWQPADISAAPASGSWWGRPASVIIAPCSMGTLGSIAAGLASTLILRIASVALKERIPLILVPRESPLSIIHLRNMLELAQAGAVVMPFSPGFYLQPQTISQMLDQFCCRILDQLGLPHEPCCWNPEA